MHAAGGGIANDGGPGTDDAAFAEINAVADRRIDANEHARADTDRAREHAADTEEAVILDNTVVADDARGTDEDIVADAREGGNDCVIADRAVLTNGSIVIDDRTYADVIRQLVAELFRLQVTLLTDSVGQNRADRDEHTR